MIILSLCITNLAKDALEYVYSMYFCLNTLIINASSVIYFFSSINGDNNI